MSTDPRPLAITSLLLGSLGFCTAGLTGLIGFVLGIVAVLRKAPGGGPVRGHGLAVAGLVVSALSLLVGPVLVAVVAAVAIPSLAAAKQTAHNARSMMALRQLAAATRAYLVQHDQGLPPVEDWVVVLDGYAGGIRALVTSPDGVRTYAMNRALEGRRLEDVAAPALTVLFFEAEPGSPLAGGPELLPATPGFVQGYAVVFVDGHADNVPRERIGRLVW